MKIKLTTPLLAAIGAVVLVAMLFLSFYLSTTAYRSGGINIVLPSENQEEPVVSPADNSADESQLSRIELTPENVQDVIATLDRPESYQYIVDCTLYYSAGKHTFTSYQAVQNDACRTDELSASGSVQRSILRYKDAIYAWEHGSRTYYTGNQGTFSDDSTVMLPTYEDVLALPLEQIIQAEWVNLNYEPCVQVSSVDGEYRSVYAISTISGLLIRAEFYKEGTLTRDCAVRNLSTEEPPTGVFALPDGVSVFAKAV